MISKEAILKIMEYYGKNVIPLMTRDIYGSIFYYMEFNNGHVINVNDVEVTCSIDGKYCKPNYMSMTEELDDTTVNISTDVNAREMIIKIYDREHKCLSTTSICPAYVEYESAKEYNASDETIIRNTTYAMKKYVIVIETLKDFIRVHDERELKPRVNELIGYVTTFCNKDIKDISVKLERPVLLWNFDGGDIDE